MQNRPPPSNQDILLFRTITEADEATSAAYLRANNNISEALNAFFNNRVAQVQVSRSQTMPTMSTSNRPSQPQTQATQVRTQSIVPTQVRTQAIVPTQVRTQSQVSTQMIRNPQVVQQSASTSRHRSRSRKSKKDRRKSAAPATGLVEVNSDEKKKKTVVPKKKERSPGPKRTFSDMITQCMKANLNEEAKKNKWPKYLGSLKVECELELHMVNTEVGQIDVGDAVNFNIPDIEFKVSNFRKTIPTYTVRGASLLVEVLNGKKRIGYIRCAYEEMFYFLLHMKYITMEGTVMTKPALPGNGKMKMNRFETRVDIFLTEWVISNPLNIMATRPGRKVESNKIEPEKPKEDNPFDFLIKKKKKNTKKEDDPSEEEQKTQQISRMAKESFIKLFGYLQIKINIPTVVQLKKRADPFNPVRRDKYGGYRITFHDTHIYCYDKAPELITTDYPIYYEKREKPNAIQQEIIQHAIAEEPDSSMEIIKMGSAKKEENPEETKARIEQDLNELEKKLLMKMTAEDNAMFSQKPKKINRRRTHAFGTYAFEDDESSEDAEEYNSEDSEEDNIRQLFKSKSEIKERNRVSSPPKNQEDMMPIDNPKPAPASNNDFYNPFQGLQQQQNREITHDVSSSEDQGGEAKDGIKSHLNDLFNLQNQNSNSFSLSEPPKTFKSTLHMYQKQALTWMKYREGCLENQRLYDKLNEEIRLLNDLFEEIVLIDGSKIYFNPFNGEITLDFPLSKPTKGGILADEMGLGKTVMTIALIHAHCREAKKKEKEEKKKDTSQKKKRRRRGSDSDDEEDEEEQKAPDADDDDHGSEYDEDDIDNIASKRGPKKNKKVKKSVGSLQPDVSNGKAGTLIVVPVTVLSQWEDEIYTHSHEGTMKVLQYYGGARSFKKNKIEDFDVVLTTYGVLSADYTKQEKGNKNKSATKSLFDYEWFRVILDEAHNVKEKSTRAAKAACGLNTSYRWCLSGTPIQNKIDDIFSIVKFLKVDTWCEYFLWNTYINKHVSNEESFELLRNILRPILLRRTKKSTYSDGTCILALPPKEINTHAINLTAEEKQIYDYLFFRGKNQFDQIVNGGTLQYEYAHVFELLMRLRQVCNHPGLVFSGADLRNSDNLESAILKFLDKRATSSTLNNNKKNLIALPPSAANKGPQNKNNSSAGISSGFVQETIDNLKNKRLDPCTVCLDDIMEPVVTNCCHVFCKGCISDVIERLKSCPICRKSLTMGDIISVVIEDREDYAEILDIKSDNFKKSSKLVALFEHVHEIRKKKEKCIVFSQFLGMLNLIQKCLEEEKIPFRRIDGSCTQKQRADYIEQFNEDDDICVFMISLKAGAVGLNLTVANHVILVDPWWNPAIEDQAIERVHRIGQKKKVFVTRLICDKTIEARIIELHSVKKGLVNMTLQFNPEQQKKQNMENMIHLMKRFDDK